jgi:hypothetical protein
MEVRWKQVERLQEQRTAVIYRAITAGLDSNAKMRPSAIEWLGDGNSNWRSYDVKHLAEVIAGGTPKSSEFDFWDQPSVAEPASLIGEITQTSAQLDIG